MLIRDWSSDVCSSDLTLVWTDTLQSGFLLLAVVLSIVAISQELNLGFFDLIGTVADSTYSKTFFWDPKPTSFFVKQFLAGVFIAVAMNNGSNSCRERLVLEV